MTRRATISLLLLLCFTLQGQTSYPRFRAYREVTKTAAAEVFTIQLPPSASKQVELDEISIYCEADIDVTIEQNGTSATSTYIVPTVVNGVGANAVASPFHSSNTTGGTTIDKWSIYGGTTAVIKLSGIVIPRGMTTPKNITIRTTSFTGRLTIRADWTER